MPVLRRSRSRRSKPSTSSSSPTMPPSLSAVIEAYREFVHQWSAFSTTMLSARQTGWQVSFEPSSLPRLMVSPAPVEYRLPTEATASFTNTGGCDTFTTASSFSPNTALDTLRGQGHLFPNPIGATKAKSSSLKLATWRSGRRRLRR